MSKTGSSRCKAGRKKVRRGIADMAEVKILIEGYAREENGVWSASPASVLIKDGGLKILADPGANKKLLLDALGKEGLKPEDIDIVFLTHYHLDHILNIRLFPEKDVYDGNTINSNDKIIEYSGNIPNTNIQVIPTPGHAHEHCSLLVKTNKGRIAVAGDVFWWADNQEQKTDRESLMKHKDPYVKDEKDLSKSRETLLRLADYIIPGHGRMFRVEK